MGTRFGGLKQLKPLGPGNNVLLEYTAFDAIRAGFRNVVFIIQTSFADEFRSLVSALPNDVSVQFAFQDEYWPEDVPHADREKPWGTSHALLSAQQLVNGPFVVCNADDYYGVSAFAKAAEFFDRQDSETAHYGMLGYRLDATLSGHGSVTRAVCQVSDRGDLTSVSEQPKISCRDGVIYSETGHGEEIELNADDRVSMNFWMLTPSVFRFLDTQFRDFLEHHRHDTSAECLLPDAIQDQLQRGEVIVDCLPHDEDWFGLTHSSDYEIAATAIQALHDNGTYPTPLWQNDA